MPGSEIGYQTLHTATAKCIKCHEDIVGRGCNDGAARHHLMREFHKCGIENIDIDGIVYATRPATVEEDEEFFFLCF